MTARDRITSPVGLPEFLDDQERREILTALDELWRRVAGQRPGELSTDLLATRRWFDPVAQGQRLRKELAALEAMPADWSDPGAPLTLEVGQHRYLVTPEGRCAMDLLASLPDRSAHLVDEGQLAHYDRILAVLYRDWSRHRLNSVIELLRGTTKPLQIPAAAVLVALLVNRCTDESRALTRFGAGPRREIVDKAFFAAVQAFADVVAPDRRGKRTDPRLVSGWMLYEAGRRVGDGLVIVDAKAGGAGRVWIQPDAIEQVIDLIARDLQRGHRTTPDPDAIAEAFDRLVTALRSELPALAAFGLVHERPTETRRLRASLLAAVKRHSR